jgi:amino acid adenylation domain-containing protein
MAGKLSISNPQPRKLAGPELLHDLVPPTGQQGNHIAIDYIATDPSSSRQLTYEQLHRQADVLAQRIISQCPPSSSSSPSPERLIVPLLIPQCPDLYISQLAILKAGGAFCPIVLDVPEERLRFILNDIGACVLLTHSNVAASLPRLENIAVIAVDREDLTKSQASTPSLPLSSQNAAYVMYTSGSTGQPKGVLLSHGAATQALLAHDKYIPDFSRFLQFASPTFDVSVFEIFFPLFRGQTLVCCDRRELLNDLPSTMNRLRVDAAELTPSVAGSLLRKRSNVPLLKVLLTIGEMLKPGVVEEFGGDAETPSILQGMYGPTEATIHCTLQPNFEKSMSCGSIGIPLDTVSAFIVRPETGDEAKDADPEILPLEEEGELAVGGYQLADGYLNREEQTRKAFITHPEHGRLYRTGDRAKMLPDGRFECLGRISAGQVKLRGQRIELGEIEHAASKTPGCSDVVADVIGGILVAFCALDAGAASAEDVVATCRKWLPAYMVPGDIVVMEALPYLASGKLDRKLLRENFAKRDSEGQGDDAESQDPETKRILEVIRNVLGTAAINSNTGLATVGLDSISAIRLASYLSKEGFPRLDASRILAARTPKDLQTLISQATKTTVSSKDVPDADDKRLLDSISNSPLLRKSSDSISGAYACTAVQAAMLNETSKNTSAYCNWIEFSLSGSQDVGKVTGAIRKLAQHHEMLRSGFITSADCSWGYAVVVWAELSDAQVVSGKLFSHDFRIDSEEKLLRPCEFQISHGTDGIKLLLKLHHATYDQWSVDILRSDLQRLLEGEELHEKSSFASVAAHHQSITDDDSTSAAPEFWQNQLRNVAPTTLPLLRAQKVPSELQRSSWIDLSTPSSALKSQARALGCSSPAIFQAALAILLSQYAGVADITFGSVFSGRTIAVPDIERVFGPCLATLPLRVDVASVRTCGDLLRTITDQNRAIQEFVLTPPTAIKRAAGVSPGISLFDTLFVWQENSFESESAQKVKIVDSADQLEFNLVLEFEPLGDTLKARATYQASLISREQVDILLAQINDLVASLLKHSDDSISTITSTLPAELLSIANPDFENVADEASLVHMIEKRASSVPSAMAISFAQSLEPGKAVFRSITFAELDEASNQAANAMIVAGLRPNDLVCVCMEKSIEMYVMFLASLKAGAGYLPLVPETPLSRVENVLRQAKPALCVVDGSLIPDFKSVTSIKVVDKTTLEQGDQNSTAPDVPQNRQRIAYAVYTSGSTGTPKGVAVTVENLHGNLAVLAELYQTKPGDRLLQSCSQAFDVSVFEIFYAFYSGLCLCSAVKDVIFRDFEHSIRAFGATHLSLTPTVAALVDPANVPDVKFLVTAGEAVTERVHKLWAGKGLNQGYGPSETTNICTINMRVTPDDVLGNIGPPFRNTSAFVLAPEEDPMRILPSGCYGEYAFGGEQVFRGYIGMDKLNAQKIIDHPTYGRVYRSGDMGRILHDGTLLISGRLDDQVKIRGNRVELGEISAVVIKDEAVADCTTLMIGEKSAEQLLATFWVPREQVARNDSGIAPIVDQDPKRISALFTRIEETLPAYMIPSVLLPITRLPLTTQGKLDKRLLKSIYNDLDSSTRELFSHHSEAADDQEPLNSTEQIIASALADLLHVPVANISRHSSFFGLGLNSLNAISLARSLEQKSQARLDVSTIMRNPSAARLAQFLLKKDESSSTNAQPDVDLSELFTAEFKDQIAAEFSARKSKVEAIWPCTPLQEAMLSASAAQENGSYSNSVRLKISGDLDRLIKAWEEVTQRHAILRTSFVETQSSEYPYAQVVQDRIATPVVLVDGTSVKSSSDVTISHAEPFKIVVDRREPGEVDLYLLMHHAIYDGISMENLYKEVQTLYNDGTTLSGPASFAAFLQEVIKHNQAGSMDFWRNKFANFTPHTIPAIEGSAGEKEDCILSTLKATPADVNTFCERHSVTVLSVFQAAWIKTLASLQEISDVCMGNVVSGRTVAVADVENLIAPCFNTIPSRVNLETVRSNIDLTRHLHRANVEASSFQLTALRRIQKFSQSPELHLFNTLLLLQPPSTSLDGSIWTVQDDVGSMGLPLVVEIVPHDDRFDLKLYFLGSRVSTALANEIRAAFDAALSSSLRYPSSHPEHFLDYDRANIAGKLAPVKTSNPGNQSKTSSDAEPWTAEEEIIRAIFAELAQVDRSKISKSTSLYRLGLDSLNAVQVASKMRKQKLMVDTADVMRLMTPIALAEFVSSASKKDQNESQASIDLVAFENKHKEHILSNGNFDSVNIEAIRPCTAAQSGMLSQSIQSNGKLYVNHVVYTLPEDHNLDEVRLAWDRVQRKHQVLRMAFQQVEDPLSPFTMVILDEAACKNAFTVEDEDRSLEDLTSHTSTDIVQNLDLPAWRVKLIKGASQQSKMCLSIHHALYDANSLQLILSDFAAAIAGEDGSPATTIDTVLAYILDGATRAQKDEGAFWKQKMEKAAIAKFPSLTPTVVTDGKIEVEQITSSASYDSILAFCRKEGATLQALGQGLWGSLLATYIGEPSVTFGTVLSGNNDDSKPVAFPTITTIPVACNTNQGLLATIRDMVAYNSEIQRYRFTPLAEIQRHAGHSGRALFDTVFVYQKSAETSSSSHQLDWPILYETAAVDYTVSLELEVTSNRQVHFRLTFDTRVLPQAHASLMLRQLDQILAEALAEKDIPVESFSPLLAALPPKERSIETPIKLLHEFVEYAARQHPEKPALEFVYSLEDPDTRKVWTYRELDERGNQIANMIRNWGIGSGNMIAVCMSKSPEATFAFLGILKAGCAFLAMDPDLPIARKTFILEDSNAKVLFVDSGATMPEAPSATRVVECIESTIIHESPLLSEPAGIDPSATSYCLYTSGTTGTPKGCELTHENAVQAMMSFQRLFAGRWTDSSRWLQFASYWFDVSVLEQFWSWSVGITLVGAPRDLVLEDLAEFIRTVEITHIDLTPSLARILTPEDVPCLCGGVFITGGEALKQEIIDAWGPKVTVCNGYGPTEATIGVTMNPFVGTDAKPTNIGPAFDNVGAYVFRPDTDEPVWRGAVGELCVFGKLVGKGYLNRPDLTAKAFPYLERHSERFYRTGDLVRMLSDGSFSFIGRKDTQAKLRGQRLEIDEIDAVIQSSTEGISEVASLVIKVGEANRETLVSFIVHEAEKSRELRVQTSEHASKLVHAADQACRDHLPGYMVPTHIVPISKLPLTVNNKVDSKRLVALFSELTPRDLQGLKNTPTETRELNTAERKLANVLSRVLSVTASDMTPQSNVFSLGLTSVSAISFATALKRGGFENANVATVMKSPTIERLANALANTTTDGKVELNAIQQAKLSISAFSQRYRNVIARSISRKSSDIESIAPCTPLQAGLLTESAKNSERPYYNNFAYDLIDVDAQRLEQALVELHGLTPILRTVFVQTDEGYAQVVLRENDFKITRHELQQDDDFENWHGDHLAFWKSQADRQDFIQPFEATLVRTPSKLVLIFHAHHSIYDGISWELTMDHLASFYLGKPMSLGPNFIDALPYGPLLQRSDAKPFWADYLKKAIFTALPLASSSTASTGDVVCQKAISGVAGLEQARRSLGVSHQAIFQAAFVVVLHQFSPHTRTYGNVLSGRSVAFENADVVLGPMFNTVPFVVDLDASEDWTQLLQRCHERNTALLPFQHSSLRDIKKFCGRTPADPVFDVLLVCQSVDNTSERLSSKYFKVRDSQVHAEFPMAFEVEFDEAGSINITAATAGNVKGEISLSQFVTQFEEALKAIGSDSKQRVGDKFSISTTEDRVDSRRLSEDVTDNNQASDFQWTTKARKMQEIISTLANCAPDSVTPETTIYTLGLDSIDAVKLSSRFKRAGLALPVSKILQAQTLPKMLELVQTRSSTGTQVQEKSMLSTLQSKLEALPELASLLKRDDVERILPATPAQEGMVADMLRSGFEQYFNHDVLLLQESVDMEKLRQAWETVLNASPIWRTSFIEISSSELDVVYAQVVHRPVKINLQPMDLKNVEEIPQTLDQIKTDFQRSNLDSSPLLCLRLIKCDDKRYLILSLAHALYDGHSLSALHEDVAKAYYGEIASRPSYDSTIEASLQANAPEARQFWQTLLSDAKPCSIERKKDVMPTRTCREERVCSTTADSARHLCQKLGVSMQTLAQATFALLLAGHSKTLDVVFGIVLGCRDSEEAESVIFPTMNTVPLRILLHGSGSEILRHVQGISNDILPFQRTPLRTIQAASASVVDSRAAEAGAGLFDALFIYQQTASQESEAQPELYDSIDGAAEIEYPLAVELQVVKQQLIVRVASKNIVLSEQETAHLLEQFDNILRSLVGSPEQSVIGFSGDEVSILGMPAFKLYQTEPSAPQEEVEGDVSGEEDNENPTMDTICKVISEVAKLDTTMSRDTAFDSIGIDSISAIKVSSLLRKQDVKISVSQMLKAKTPRRMAEAIQAQSSSVSTEQNISSKDVIAAAVKNIHVANISNKAQVPQSTIESILPATAGQVYMLNLWRATGGQLFYPTFKFHVKTQRSAEEVRTAWNRLVKQQAILRTIFVQSDNTSVPVLQVVLKEGTQSFSVAGEKTDMTSNQEQQQQQCYASLHATRVSDGYDVDLKIHHALYDAVSLPLLLQSLQNLLDKLPTPLPSIGAEDFLALPLTREAQLSRKKFWTSYFSDLKPIISQQPTQQQGAQNKVEIFQPRLTASCGKLETLARQNNISIQSILFATYAKLHAQRLTTGERRGSTDATDLVLGIYLSNRGHLPDLDQLAYPALNLVPLCIRNVVQSDLMEVARQISSGLAQIGTVENSTTALWEIEQWTGIQVDLFLNYLKLPERSSQGDGDSDAESRSQISEVDGERRMPRSRLEKVESSHQDSTTSAAAATATATATTTRETFHTGKAYQVRPIIPGSFPSTQDRSPLHTFTDHFSSPFLQHAIDIEMTITDDGGLDFGLFAPQEMLGLDEGEALVAGVKEKLEKLV